MSSSVAVTTLQSRPGQVRRHTANRSASNCFCNYRSTQHGVQRSRCSCTWHGPHWPYTM
ncbi:hypothetical protein [Streptomyces malaysiensis]|uniref:hypothetical protein n=1 Tax=Streptomyces malaysiensis TaxID=92644 RepID=UPI00163D8058|nr:hypothetical protein [Streptomyces malaysiensis]